MNIAILTFDGFNELDSFIAFGILNRVKKLGWSVNIAAPSDTITSKGGVTIQAQQSLEFANTADAVIFGSGTSTREIAKDDELLSRLNLDSSNQIIGSQCSGVLLMAALGLLNDKPICTDLKTRPFALDAGLDLLDQPFTANNNIATAGGCMSSQYLATWVIAKLTDIPTAEAALHFVAPIGNSRQYISETLGEVSPYL